MIFDRKIVAMTNDAFHAYPSLVLLNHKGRNDDHNYRTLKIREFSGIFHVFLALRSVCQKLAAAAASGENQKLKTSRDLLHQVFIVMVHQSFVR